MELDELGPLWREGQGRAEVRLEAVREVRGGVLRTRILVGLELVVALATAGLAAAFLARDATAAHLALAGGFVLLFATWEVAVGLRQVALLAGVDPSGAVLQQQRRLEALRVLRLRATRVAFLAGLVGWVAFPIVAARGLLGVDLVEVLGPAWVLANVAVGVVLVPTATWLLSRPAFARLRDHVSGRSLGMAQRDLERVRRFDADG